jgi:hypothetical protein
MGQLHADARSAEELDTHVPFQGLNARGESWLGDVQCERGATHVPLARYGHETFDLTVEHRAVTIAAIQKIYHQA